MVTLLAASVVAMPSFAIEKVNLVRAYKAGDTAAYSLHVEMPEMGAAIDAEIVFKVKKDSTDGGELSMSTRKFSIKRDGNDMGSPGPEEVLSPFDKFGMPHVMQTENEAYIYILTALAGLVPGKEVEVGGAFELKWTSKDKTFSADGKGTLKEIVDLEGAKTAKLDYEIEVRPGNDSPGTVKCQSMIDLAGMVPQSCEGAVTVEGNNFKFTVKRLKA